MARLTHEIIVERLENLPGEAVGAISARAALRALPALSSGSRNWKPFWYWPEAEGGYRALVVLHAYSLAVLGTSMSRPIPPAIKDAIEAILHSHYGVVFRSDLREAIAPAALRASHWAEATAAENEYEGKSREEIRAGRRATADAVAAAIKALSAAVGVLFQPTSANLRVDPVQRATIAITRAIAAMGSVRGEVEADLESGIGAESLMALPLWRDGLPATVAQKWENLASDLQRLDAGFEVWIDWYNARLEGRPLDTHVEIKRVLIPQEIFAQDPGSINGYIKQIIKDGSKLISLNRVRALFLGHGDAGKTSLIAALHGETVVAGDKMMTPGLEIHDAEPHVLWRESKPGDGRPAVYFWDFGGQVMAHHTHQFFLRSNCVYVIVLDGRRNNSATEDARYWLEHVRAYGKGSPVLIVGNKIDLAAVSVDTAALSRSFPNIVGYFPLSCTGAKDTHLAAFTTFRREFEARLQDMANSQVMLTKGQHDLIASLHERERGAAFMSRADYMELCRKHGIGAGGSDLNEEQLLDILDTLGVVVHFRDIRTLDAMLLNPEWLTKGVYTIFYSEVSRDKFGRLRFTDFLSALNERPILDQTGERLVYDRARTTFIVDAMRRFKLCYQVPEDEEQLILPALLADKEPEFTEHGFDIAQAWSFRFRFEDFMPEHVLPSLMVDRHADIARTHAPPRDLVWKRGMLLRPERYRASAFVVVDAVDRTLTAHIDGPDGEEYLGVLRECVRRSLDKMRHLVLKEEVALTLDMRLDEPRFGGAAHGPEWAPFAQIQEHLKAGQRDYVGPEGGRYSLARINPRLPAVGQQIELLTRIDDIVSGQFGSLVGQRATHTQQARTAPAPLGPPLHLRIFLSSPGDVIEERRLARELIKQVLPVSNWLRNRVTFDLVSWDDPHSSIPLPAHLTPQMAIKQGLKSPSECDIVIVVLWSRFGTPLPYPEYKKEDGSPYYSGTEWEFEDAMRARKASGIRPTVLLYRRDEEPLVKLRDPEKAEKERQYESVCNFFDRLRNPGGSILCSSHAYVTPEEFRNQLNEHIQFIVQKMIETPEAPPVKENLPNLLNAAHNTLLGLGRRSPLERQSTLARLRSQLNVLESTAVDPEVLAVLHDLECMLGERSSIPAR